METPSVAGNLKRYKGKWTSEEIKHLLKRTMFGAAKSDIDFFSKHSLRFAVKQLLDTEEPEPAPPVNNYNDDKYTDEEILPGQTWITAKKLNGMNSGRRRNSYKAWWMGLMLNQERTIREKMVLFWHNHFATETNTVDNPTMCYKYNVLLRQYALGNFKDLVKAITLDPAMLKYLNGNANTKKAPDENYGRELQELFTVGKGPGSHYTEGDVKAAARVLTGFRIDDRLLPEVHGIFDGSRHDETNKQFSAFYGGFEIKGQKGKDGGQELDDMLAMIFAREEPALFICRKLYRFFVYHQVDNAAEKNIIVPLAKTFRKNDYAIKPVLKQLFSSRHFFDNANRGAMIKSPVDYTAGLCRELAIPFPETSDYVVLYGFWSNLQTVAAQLQQNIGDPPNVAGWPAYYQEPQYDKIWINSDTLPKRNQFTDRMLYSGFARNGKKIIADVYAIAGSLSNPGNPDTLINESVQLLYMMDLPEKEKIYIKEGILLSGLQGNMSDHYWTDAWNKMKTNPTDKANQKDVLNKLRSLYKYLMNLPQYQLC
jgi:uncharacterized protein (DUF1800 family)